MQDVYWGSGSGEVIDYLSAVEHVILKKVRERGRREEKKQRLINMNNTLKE